MAAEMSVFMNPVSLVQSAMIDYFAGDVRRINHFLKVYGFAKAIGELEGLEAQSQFVLEIAALTHDIGIRNSERKFNSSSGEHQQVEGPPEAKKLLESIGISPNTIERVCWLIAHHHTYQGILDTDYQILVEADFLINIGEDGLSLPAIAQIEEQIFRTRTGLRFLHRLYLPSGGSELTGY